MNEITMSLDRSDPRPLTEQLYHFLKREIIQGNFTSNDKLPSKRRLARTLGCSINTIEGAYHQLVDEGYLLVKEKSGYYVTELDGLVHLGEFKYEFTVEQEVDESYRHDFSYHGVDFDHFPFQQWRRITREVIDQEDRDLLRMGDPKGSPGLRMNIARYLHHSRGVECTPSQIVISSGTEYLLQVLFQLFEGSPCYGIENPGYEKLNLLFRSNRENFKALELDDQGLCVDELERHRVDVVCITPSHQFPTGCIMPVTRRLQLLGWASSCAGRYIIEDDYDSEFRYLGKPIPSLQGMDRSGRVIYMGSFSKSLSPALRISYMVLPKHLCEVFDNSLHFLNCPVPIIEQKVLALFMERGHFERHLNRMRNLYRQKRETLVSAISKLLPLSRIEGASAGLHLIIRVGNGMDEHELEETAKEYGVKVYGLTRYYSEGAVDAVEPKLLLGFATMGIGEMDDAILSLRKAWYR